MPVTDTTQIAIDVKLDDDKYRRTGSFVAPPQNIPESEKTSVWFWNNIQYILTFYNRPVGIIAFPNAQTTPAGGGPRGASDMLSVDREYPVQFMIRMMQYYLGKQPNLNYAWVTSDVTTTNMQAQWIKGQEVSEFVNFFKGMIMQRTSNAYFTARPISKDATSEREDVFNKLMMKYDLQPFFDQMAQMGAEYNPANAGKFEMPEQVGKWMDTNFKEFGAEMAGDMANGIWFTNHWNNKVLQAFMHVVITSVCAMEHYVENGRSQQRIRMPYQLIIDNGVDDDYGTYDEFIGVIDNMTPLEIFRTCPNLSTDQQEAINTMARDQSLGTPYNTSQNITWWNYGSIYRDNTVSVVRAYWRTRHDLGFKKKVNRNGIEKYKKAKQDEITDSVVEDIALGELVGNRFLTKWGYIDNLVEAPGNKSRPLFPIIRFRPNTFMGESISEVARIHRIQDELDMYDFKIREMIGRANGKTYVIRGSKLGPNTPKQLLDDLKSVGFTILDDSGESEDQDNNRRLVEQIDFSLDPGIANLSQLYIERRERMGRILNTSQASMGQLTKYMGLGSLQNAQAQSSLGVAYLIDGFMDWIVKNMRYAVNQQVKLAAFGKEDNLPFLIGDRGMKYLEIMDKQKLKFEDFLVALTVNDIMDDKRKERLVTIAQSESQNGKLSINEFITIESGRSLTEIQESLAYAEKEKDKKQAQIAANQAKMEAAASQQAFLEKGELEQLKQDNENYRKQLDVLTKHVGNLMGSIPPPVKSPVQQELTEATQQEGQEQQEEPGMQQ